MLVKLFIINLFLLTTIRRVSGFEIPDATIEVFTPRGFRVSIPGKKLI